MKEEKKQYQLYVIVLCAMCCTIYCQWMFLVVQYFVTVFYLLVFEFSLKKNSIFFLCFCVHWCCLCYYTFYFYVQSAYKNLAQFKTKQKAHTNSHSKYNSQSKITISSEYARKSIVESSMFGYSLINLSI